MAAKKYFVDIDLQKNELVSAVLHNTTSGGVATPVAGQIIFDTDSDTLKYYDGTAWQSSETRLDGALQYKGSIAHGAAAAVCRAPVGGDRPVARGSYRRRGAKPLPAPF